MPKLSNANLTFTRIQRAKVARNKDGVATVSYLWDAEVPGFGLRINTTGKKSFVMKYRNPEGKQAWLVLGDYDGLDSIETTRTLAKEYRGVIKKKLDPKTGITKALAVPTFAKFAEAFLEIQEGRVSDSYHVTTTYFLKRVAIPQIGALRMDMVEQRHVSDLLEAYAQGERPWLKGEQTAPPVKVNSNRFRAVLNVLFKYAEEKGVRPRNSSPCTYIKKAKESKGNKRYLDGEEIAWLGKVLRDAPKWDDPKACPYAFNKAGVGLSIPTPYAVAAIRLLLLTGARKNEILRMKWSGVNKAKGLLFIEEHKTAKTSGTKEIPLNPAVLAILEELEKLRTRILGGEWVIQGHNNGKPMVNISKPWSRVQEAVKRASGGKANIDDVNIHVLRHSFASVGISNGIELFMVGSLLGHADAATTQRYAHLFKAPKMVASTQISGTIAEWMGGRA